jgi:hypothetical protein
MLTTGNGKRQLRTIAATVLAALTLASPIVSAASGPTIVIRNDDLITPSALTMNRGDVLEFENDSGQFVKVVFMDPDDQTDKIRCSLIDHTTARPYQEPWLLFDWGAGRRLTATMPPGRFASACSLVPGRYTFVATRVSRDPRGSQDSLGTKGIITVQ